MFQFPRFPSALRRMPGLFIRAGFPIRRSPAKLARQLTEAYRSLATSFFGLQRLGIHRAPLVALTTTPLSTQHIVLLLARVDPSGHQLYSLVNVRPAVRRAFGPQGALAAGGSVGCLWRRIWWSRGDSNPRHPPCKGGALPAELRPHLLAGSGGRWWTRTTDLGLIRTAL